MFTLYGHAYGDIWRWQANRRHQQDLCVFFSSLQMIQRIFRKTISQEAKNGVALWMEKKTELKKQNKKLEANWDLFFLFQIETFALYHSCKHFVEWV